MGTVDHASFCAASHSLFQQQFWLVQVCIDFSFQKLGMLFFL